ncbi:hypothetical protein NQ318_011724 [Aromia moschata]|uniref:Uncharacterized protein n=1 Tax=Aromia moschata TaxID=1265417 RepID=A0AAV8XQ81_9CUCU|nr:hypothetical protein NQ318_011724 [Aromia moschata]
MKIIKTIKSEISINVEPDRVLAFQHRGLHENIRFVIIIAQFFGVMPLHNINQNIHAVKFKWMSFRLFYSIFNALAALVSLTFWIIKFAVDGLDIDKTAPMAFYFCNFFSSLQLIQIARHWSHILKEWSFVEMSMRSYSGHINLKKSFIILTTLFIGVGVVAIPLCALFKSRPG